MFMDNVSAHLRSQGQGTGSGVVPDVGLVQCLQSLTAEKVPYRHIAVASPPPVKHVEGLPAPRDQANGGSSDPEVQRHAGIRRRRHRWNCKGPGT